MKKILLILPTLDAGGAENYTLRFVRYCEDRYAFSVLSVAERKGDLHDEFTGAGAKVFYQSIGYFNPIKWLKLYFFLRQHRFDGICTMNGNFGGVPMMLAKLAGIKKRIAFYRRSTIAFKPTRLRLAYNQWAGNLVYRNATDILSNSVFALQNFFGSRHLTDNRFHVISNGVDVEIVKANESKEFYRQKFNIPVDAFVIGHVGRFDPAKNHETIFRIAEKLITADSSFRFVFCGKGTDSINFRNNLILHGILEQSICLGLQDKIGSVLKTFDVFLFPSITEGQPNALIEAMLSGVPLLASNIETIKCTVPPYYIDQLVDPLDVNGFVERLMAMRAAGSMPANELKKFALETFDSEKRFNEFKYFLDND